jgi:hypothetical protein
MTLITQSANIETKMVSRTYKRSLNTSFDMLLKTNFDITYNKRRSKVVPKALLGCYVETSFYRLCDQSIVTA